MYNILKLWNNLILRLNEIDYIISEDDILKLQNWCSFEKWKIIETEEYKTSVSSKNIQEIKANYNNIILEKYSYTDQINMSAEIQEIHLVTRLEKREFTDEEMLKVQEATQMKTWIDSMRTECKEKISELI